MPDVAPSLDAALGRVALVVRAVGAVWLAALAGVYGLTGQLAAPTAAVVVVAIGVTWTALLAASGQLGRSDRRSSGLLLMADLCVVALVLLIPPVAGEVVGYAGGYPFAALVVGLAVAGPRGVWVAVAVLSALVLANLVVVGAAISSFVVGQILLYVFGGAAILAAVEVLRRAELRAREAESALAVATERAETAAHLHDSVLQTLALVHRRAEDPGQVRTLVRRQERDLRAWLFGERTAAGTATLEAALAELSDSVADDHGVQVSAVVSRIAAGVPADTVGPLLAAAGEALANAAVHAGVTSVDVFADIEESELVVFVRDRGRGFDPATVPDDRQGVRGSIEGRMRRAGGTAKISSTEGRGTEVELRMPKGSA